MPVVEIFTRRDVLSGLTQTLTLAERAVGSTLHTFVERVNIPGASKSNLTGFVDARTRDPFQKSSKYALAWVYFGITLVVFAALMHFYHATTDRIRTALHEDEVQKSSVTSSPSTDFEMAALKTDKSTAKLFPRHDQLNRPQSIHTTTAFWAFRPFNMLVAVFRYIFYRPAPKIQFRKQWGPIEFPPFTVIFIGFAGLTFSVLYCFLPQPLFRQSMQFGSPPLGVRAGMMAVAMTPWIVAMSMKANVVSVITGIGHERLNVLHRWGGYLCLILSLIHTIPFYVQRAQDPSGYAIYTTYFQTNGMYIFATGIAALAPLAFLCIHSLPFLRRMAYEVFVFLHVPVAILYVAMLLWHCRNFLTSWSYLYATIAIWLSSYVARIFFLNWTNPRRVSWLVGDDASVTLMPENAIKITIPTQVKWRPGQYVYLRMPGIAVFENHPFTIASLCSDDLPSEYGDDYKDMVLVFRPFGGFTKRVLNSALEKGPWHTYRAFVDGPYGGMKRKLESFDQVILIAGGSGITAIVSQLLDLIKRMRDGKAITKNVQVIWALKRPETMEWFKEELRICRECAPPDSVKCQFFITAAKRQNPRTMRMTAQTTQQHIGTYFRDHINDAFNGIAEKRASYMSKRNSAYIRDEAEGDPDREKQLRDENEDVIAALPQAHLVPANQLASEASSIRNFSHPLDDDSPDSEDATSPYEHYSPDSYHSPSDPSQYPNPYPPSGPSKHNIDRRRDLAADIKAALAAGPSPHLLDPNSGHSAHSGNSAEGGGAFDFGFPSTPTEFQKNLMRFAFLPATTRATDGWTTEYGRPDLPFMLRDMADGFPARTAVFVCGPPGMRVAVSKTVADLQRYVLGRGNGVEEIFLHTENYAL